jgi:glycosyltransferase involved in cell wall biosynthesis
MRRVLLIAYHFPPQPAAGALRPKFLARYLPQFGWEPTVLTRPCGAAPDVDCRIETAPVLGEAFESSVRSALGQTNGSVTPAQPSALRKALRTAKEVVSFPDRAVGWWLPAVAKGLQLCDTYRFDAIVSTAMPPTAHLVAGTIARLRNLPWVADFRDPWSGNHMHSASAVRARAERALESWLLRRAIAITAVPTIADRVEDVHKRAVVRIGNAYDPSDWVGLASISPQRFELCHTGHLYEGQITPALLFEALASLRSEGSAAGGARVLFYGPIEDTVTSLARSFGIESQVEQRGVVPHEEALLAQRRASHLLVLLKMDDDTVGILGSKILEYCGAGRRILAFGPPASAMRAFIDDNRLGWFAGDLDEARLALRAAYDLYAAGDWEIRRPGVALEASRLAQLFATQLDAAVLR